MFLHGVFGAGVGFGVVVVGFCVVVVTGGHGGSVGGGLCPYPADIYKNE